MAKSAAFPEPCIPEDIWKTGFMLRLPLASAVTELARSRSKPMAIGVVPSVTGVPNVTEAVMGPEIVFCIGCFVVGSIYITVAEPMVTDAPV